MSKLAQSWKAIVAFLAPGLLLLLEPLTLGDQQLQAYDVRRALVVAVVTSVLVWLKRNGMSADLTTSTPQVDRGHADAAYLLVIVGVCIIVVTLYHLIVRV